MKRTLAITLFAAISTIFLPSTSSASTHEAGPILPVYSAKVKQVDPLPQPKVAEIAQIQPIPATPAPQVRQSTPAPAQSAPAASTSLGGCVTGYVSGDYYLDKIIQYESTGNSCATNPGGCFGLLQACPGYPLREACGGNPSCQIAWFEANKTGGRSWAQVWQHELDYGWW